MCWVLYVLSHALTTFPQQLSIESHGMGSCKPHTYTNKKSPPAVTYHYSHLQNHTSIGGILGQCVGVKQPPTAHGWCSHGTCMVCQLSAAPLSSHIPGVCELYSCSFGDHKQQASVCSVSLLQIQAAQLCRDVAQTEAVKLCHKDAFPFTVKLRCQSSFSPPEDVLRSRNVIMSSFMWREEEKSSLEIFESQVSLSAFSGL